MSKDAIVNPEAQVINLAHSREGWANLREALIANEILSDKEKAKQLIEYGLKMPGKVLPDEAKAAYRNIYTAIGTVAVGLMEPSYSYFQAVSAIAGFSDMGTDLNMDLTYNEMVAPDAVGTVGDGFANILSVTPSDNAIEALYSVNPPISPTMTNIETAIKGISFVASYPFGAAMGALPFIALIPSDWSSDARGALTGIFLALNVVPGTGYYYGFNNDPIYNCLKAFKLWWDAPDRRVNPILFAEFLITAASVVGFRSVSFMLSGGYLAGMIDESLIAPVTWYVCAGTGVNVSATRLTGPAAALLNSNYNLINQAMHDEAARQLRHQWLSATSAALAAANVSRAAGAGLFLFTLINDPTTAALSAASTTLTLASISLYSQYKVNIYALASKNMLAVHKLISGNENHSLDDMFTSLRDERRQRDGLPVPISQENKFAEIDLDTLRIQASKEKLTAIGKHFEDARLLAIFIVSACVLGQAIRLSSFFGFLPKVAGFIKVEITPLQVIAGVLFLASTNMLNNGNMFFKNMYASILYKVAQAYVAFNAKNPDGNFYDWFRQQSFGDVLALYHKAGVEYAMEDIDAALARLVDAAKAAANAANAAAPSNQQRLLPGNQDERDELEDLEAGTRKESIDSERTTLQTTENPLFKAGPNVGSSGHAIVNSADLAPLYVPSRTNSNVSDSIPV